MAAHYLKLDVTSQIVDTNAPPDILTENNPLKKIPTLVLSDGRAIFDSVAIMHFFDRESGGRLYPTDHKDRTDVEVLESLCNGALDSLLSIVYERRIRPENFVYQPWIDKQWGKVTSALDYLENNTPELNGDLFASHFALASLISYLDLRFSGKWRDNRSNLVQWISDFERAFPDFASLKSGA